MEFRGLGFIGFRGLEFRGFDGGGCFSVRVVWDAGAGKLNEASLLIDQR